MKIHSTVGRAMLVLAAGLTFALAGLGTANAATVPAAAVASAGVAAHSQPDASPAGLVSPAVTDQRCNVTPTGLDEICVVKDDGWIYGVITGFPISNLTQIVYQCDGFGRNCGIITASHANPTSKKPALFGHTYRNCPGFTDAAGNRWVGRCSPFVTGN